MAVIELFAPCLSNLPEIYYILAFKVDTYMFNSLNAVVTK